MLKKLSREEARWLGDMWRWHSFWKYRIEVEIAKYD